MSSGETSKIRKESKLYASLCAPLYYPLSPAYPIPMYWMTPTAFAQSMKMQEFNLVFGPTTRQHAESFCLAQRILDLLGCGSLSCYAQEMECDPSIQNNVPHSTRLDTQRGWFVLCESPYTKEGYSMDRSRAPPTTLYPSNSDPTTEPLSSETPPPMKATKWMGATLLNMNNKQLLTYCTPTTLERCSTQLARTYLALWCFGFLNPSSNNSPIPWLSVKKADVNTVYVLDIVHPNLDAKSISPLDQEYLGEAKAYGLARAMGRIDKPGSMLDEWAEITEDADFGKLITSPKFGSIWSNGNDSIEVFGTGALVRLAFLQENWEAIRKALLDPDATKWHYSLFWNFADKWIEGAENEEKRAEEYDKMKKEIESNEEEEEEEEEDEGDDCMDENISNSDDGKDVSSKEEEPVNEIPRRKRKRRALYEDSSSSEEEMADIEETLGNLLDDEELISKAKRRRITKSDSKSDDDKEEDEGEEEEDLEKLKARMGRSKEQKTVNSLGRALKYEEDDELEALGTFEARTYSDEGVDAHDTSCYYEGDEEEEDEEGEEELKKEKKKASAKRKISSQSQTVTNFFKPISIPDNDPPSATTSTENHYRTNGNMPFVVKTTFPIIHERAQPALRPPPITAAQCFFEFDVGMPTK